MVWFLIIIIIIICYCHYKNSKRLSQYIVFLENEYYNLINILINLTDDERKNMLNQATKTSLYKKIKYDKADSIEKFRMMHKENEFLYDDNDNNRPLGFKKKDLGGHRSQNTENKSLSTTIGVFLLFNYSMKKLSYQ